MWTLILIGLAGVEIFGYLYYLHLANFVKEKRYYNKKIDCDWMKKYLLEELTSAELIQWIKNSISYNFSDETYYTEVPFDEIPKNKMIKWTAYNLYFKSIWQLNDEQIKNAKRTLYDIEKKIGFKFKKITDPNVYFLKFGNNHIECEYRPMMIYGALNVVKNVVYGMLRYYGFKKFVTSSGIIYFFYHNEKHENTTMFIHGLGLGITPYLSYIFSLQKTSNVLIPIIPNISNMEFSSYFTRLSEDALFPSYTKWRKDFKCAFKKHNIESIDIIAHSFGTVILGLLLKDDWIRSKIKKKVFVEPVCFVDQSYKIYRYINEPAEGKDGVITTVFNLLIYKDVYVRYVSQRFLYGPEFWILDYNQMSNDDNLVIVSKKDKLVPSSTLYQRMKRYDVPCIMVDDAGHSAIFIIKKFKSILMKINGYLFKYD
jgi:predicted alpha/beta hydrolase family esterase